MKKLFKSMAIALTVVLLVSLLAPAALAAATQPLDTKAHTQAEIIKYAKRQGLKPSVGVNYSSLPDIEAPGEAGTVNTATQKAFLAALNTARYIAGLEPVKWDKATQEATMAGAVVSVMNYIDTKTPISHTPKKPAGINSALYKQGYQACKTGNIYMLTQGYVSPTSSVIAWMDDSDEMNMAKLGHRRWCLNPKMGKSSFGAINVPSGSTSLMSAQDISNTKNLAKYVAWPARQMPVEFFGPNQMWSVSIPSAPNSATVTVTRRSDNKTWNMDKSQSDGFFTVNKERLGSGNCIIFRPDGITTNVGDVYDVTVKGLSKPISYSVTFFSLGMNLSGTGTNTIFGGQPNKPGRIDETGISGTASDAGLTFSWKPVAGADGYEVRISNDNANYTVLQTSSDTSYTITDFNPDKPCYIAIRAYSQNGDDKIFGEFIAITPNKNVSTQMPKPPVVEDKKVNVPAAVENVKAKAAGKTKVTVSWAKADKATGYEVYRSTNNKQFIKVGTVTKGTKLSYTDKNVKANTKYFYKVRAYNNTDNSIVRGAYSKTVNVKTAR